MSDREVVIVSAVRTAVGRFGGALKDIHVANLAALVMREAINRAGVPQEEVQEVVFGHAYPPTDAPNIGKVGALKAGLPPSIPGSTVNRLCGSGMQAVHAGTRLILVGDADVVLVGGAENMSRYPYELRGARWGYTRGDHGLIDPASEGLCDQRTGITTGMTAEVLAEEYGISREEQDAFALRSHLNAARATKEGQFKDELLPIEVPQPKGAPSKFEVDEQIRFDISMEKLAALRPAFKQGGTVTAGNSSSLNDAACAMLLMSADKAAELGVRPLARIVAMGTHSVDALHFGMGPVGAVRKTLQRAGLTLADMDLIECNEAFAAQTLAVSKVLEWDMAKLNVNGGGVALGHPLGCSGSRLITTLQYELRRRHGRYGLATLCVGGGMGIATVIEMIY
ncbi:MAG: thiolase family protein [Chloroflexota bacterium]|nr:MAG: thiolase family protein [Chloroflexota bacterium]